MLNPNASYWLLWLFIGATERRRVVDTETM
jgi:hypothetical protein